MSLKNMIPPKKIMSKIPTYNALIESDKWDDSQDDLDDDDLEVGLDDSANYESIVNSFDEYTVHLKYFMAGFIWYVTNADLLPDGDILFYGYVVNPFDSKYSEWGSFTLNQLLSFTAFGFMHVERDKFFNPVKFSEIRKKYNLY